MLGRRVRKGGCILFDNNLSPAILPLAESNLGLCTRWSRRPWTSALMIVFFWTASPLQWINACIFHSSVFISLHTCIFHAHVVAVHVLYLFVFFFRTTGMFWTYLCLFTAIRTTGMERSAERIQRRARARRHLTFCIAMIFWRYSHFASGGYNEDWRYLHFASE